MKFAPPKVDCCTKIGTSQVVSSPAGLSVKVNLRSKIGRFGLASDLGTARAEVCDPARVLYAASTPYADVAQINAVKAKIRQSGPE